MILKIQKERQSVKINIEDESTYDQLLEIIAEKLQVDEYGVDVLVGYPPKPIKALGNQAINTLGFTSGALVSLRDNPQKKGLFEGMKEMGIPVDVCRTTLAQLDTDTATLERAIDIALTGQTNNETENDMKVTRKIINADNSCLFNAVGYLILEGEPKFSNFNPMQYRQAIADTIIQNPELYEHLLEKPVKEYAEWILNPEKWGGEVELLILSQYLHVQISAIDIRTGNLLTYGDDNIDNKRIYVIYDGVHYDAIILLSNKSTSTSGNIQQQEEITIFDSNNKIIELEVQNLAKSLYNKKQYINLSTGNIECKICFMKLSGETAAVEHAKLTGHQNFGQI